VKNDNQKPATAQAETDSACEPLAFIPATLDDAGLSPIQFRMYGHIARRAGNKGHYWESIPNAANHCGVDQRTARKAIRSLEKLNMIRCVKAKAGCTRVFLLTPPSDWSAPPTENDPSQKMRGVQKRQEGGLIECEPSPDKKCEGSPLKKCESKLLPEVSPLKAIPESVDSSRSCEHAPKKNGKVILELVDKSPPYNEAKRLEDWCFQLLGKDEMVNYGSRWRKRIQDDPGTVEKVLGETKSALNERRIRTTPAKYAEDYWARLKGKKPL
jgi:Helix-turn-helix domain